MNSETPSSAPVLVQFLAPVTIIIGRRAKDRADWQQLLHLPVRACLLLGEESDAAQILGVMQQHTEVRKCSMNEALRSLPSQPLPLISQSLTSRFLHLLLSDWANTLIIGLELEEDEIEALQQAQQRMLAVKLQRHLDEANPWAVWWQELGKADLSKRLIHLPLIHHTDLQAMIEPALEILRSTTDDASYRWTLGGAVQDSKGTFVSGAGSPKPPAQGDAEAVMIQQPISDEVQFTTYCPRAIAEPEGGLLLAFAHLADLPLEQVEKMARAVLGKRDVERQTQGPSQRISHRSCLTFQPLVEGVTFTPTRATVIWEGETLQTTFHCHAASESIGKTLTGQMRVLLDGALIICTIDLSLLVVSAEDAAKLSTSAEAATQATTAKPFANVFVSYSSKDVAIVVQLLKTLKQSPDKRFIRDKEVLQPGDDWWKEIQRHIKEADIFQLFWSTHSAASEPVKKEWTLALESTQARAIPRFIQPVFWEEHRPSPPAALSHLHFGQIELPDNSG